MLDLTGILLSSVMMVIVMVRALQKDREQPWFQTVKLREMPSHIRQIGWRRHS
jgi:hypothetical protein